MERYSDYKDSGITWLGTIPAHWSMSRFCFETYVRARLGWKGLKADEYVDDGYILLATPNIKDEMIDFENVNYITQERYDESPEIKLSTNDVLLTKDGSTLGTVNVVRELPREATVNSSIAVITPTKGMDGRYLMYYIKSSYIQNLVWLLQDGMGVPHLFQKDINKIRLIVPPVDEQKAIGDYLDRHTSKINSLLADLQSQAEMLDTYKRELAAEAVTKGLDKSATMKDSGVDYIGAIPQHWDIVPLRAYLKVVSVKNNPDLPLLSVEREKGVVDRKTEGSENNHNRIPDDLTNYKVVRAWQFVMNKMKAWRGSYGVSAYDGIVSPAYYVFDLNFPNPTFFNYTIRSAKYIGFFGRDSYGIRTDQWDFKISAIKDIPLAVPPVDEQNAIAEYLERTIPRIEGLIADINAQIEKLKQYRQIVIRDAVTGKIKVTEG